MLEETFPGQKLAREIIDSLLAASQSDSPPSQPEA
jgi:hypothetical protein